MASPVVPMGINLILSNISIGHSPMLEDRRTGFESARGYLYIPYRLGSIRALVALEEAQDMTPLFYLYAGPTWKLWVGSASSMEVSNE